MHYHDFHPYGCLCDHVFFHSENESSWNQNIVKTPAIWEKNIKNLI
jgi:hypothetical protein